MVQVFLSDGISPWNAPTALLMASSHATNRDDISCVTRLCYVSMKIDKQLMPIKMQTCLNRLTLTRLPRDLHQRERGPNCSQLSAVPSTPLIAEHNHKLHLTW